MITLESTGGRLQSIAGDAAVSGPEQARIPAEDLGGAASRVRPNHTNARTGRAPAWDANHQRYPSEVKRGGDYMRTDAFGIGPVKIAQGKAVGNTSPISSPLTG